MSFRTRLLLVSLATLAIGLGALLVGGNVLLRQRVDAEASSLLHARAQAQIAALTVTRSRVRSRETSNDAFLDRQAWVLDGGRVIERPERASPQLDRLAVALGRGGTVGERDGPRDVRLRAQPVFADDASRPTGSVVVSLSIAPLENLQQGVLIGSLVVAGLALLLGGLAIRAALNGALRPVAHMTRACRTGEHTTSIGASTSGRRGTS